jgi:hypothetical protein
MIRVILVSSAAGFAFVLDAATLAAQTERVLAASASAGVDGRWGSTLRTTAAPRCSARRVTSYQMPGISRNRTRSA